MVYRVVSTKLTEEEHTKLLDICNEQGCTPSVMIKQAIMEKIEGESKPEKKSPMELLLDFSKREERS